MVQVKSKRELDLMRQVGSDVANVLQTVAKAVRPGVELLELDAIAEAKAQSLGCKPAFKGYMGYQHALCTSVNEQIVHGIPTHRKLREGDIVGLDFGLIREGFYGDSAVTLPVGEISKEAKQLCEATLKALYSAIRAALPGNTLRDIAAAVESEADQGGYGVVREFVGHGIGRKLHEDPQVPNYVAGASNLKLKPGMTICLEPMINAGRREMRILEDGWTAVSKDGTLSAHYEHAIAITADGPEILTEWEGTSPYNGYLEQIAGIHL